MKVKIQLDPGETIEQADDKLAKALKAKKEFHDHERYEDEVLNEIHDHILLQHESLVRSLLKEIEDEVKRHAR